MKRVLAAASGGGHWEQLMLLRPAFAPYELHYATTHRGNAELHGVEDVSILPDCNQNQPVRAGLCLLKAVWLVIRLRPDVIISTGAAPGFFCILAGRMIGAKTLWIDSVANAEELSMCGKLSIRVAHQCLTQWEHLSEDPRPTFAGSIL